MATFIDLHQSQKLILVNVEAVQTVAPHLSGRPGAQVIFHDGTGIEVDENVEDIQSLIWANIDLTNPIPNDRVPTDRSVLEPHNPLGIVSEESFKSPYHILELMHDVLEKSAYRACADARLKGYVEEQYPFHFGLWSISGESHLGNYCAIIQAALVKLDNSAAAVKSLDHEPATTVPCLCDGQQLMFISGVNLLKEPEQVSFMVRSRVWLQFADFDDCVFVDTAKPPLCAVEIGESCIDRKDSPSVRKIATGEPPSEIIKGGAHVVNAISDVQSPVNLRNRFTDLELKQILGLFTIVFFANGVGLSFHEGSNFCCKQLQVFFGPPDFMPTFE
jgi:hypothetical protein